MQRTREERARILVIDDWPELGQTLADLLARAPDLECIGLSADAASAVEVLERRPPDVVVLGLHRPDGESLEALGRILAVLPTRVLAMSVDTPVGGELIVEALQRGALDFVIRPSHAQECDFRMRDELRGRIRGLLTHDPESLLASRKLDRRLNQVAAGQAADLKNRDSAQHHYRDADKRLIVAGAGAGGPRALLQLFSQLRAPLPPTVISQRIGSCVVSSLARRLDTLSPIRCKVAETGDLLQPNTAYLTPADQQTVVVRRDGRASLLVRAAASSNTHPGPSTDALMQSAAMAFGSNCLGVLLTGNGRDGVEGARAISAAGGFVLGQDRASSLAHGVVGLASALHYVDREFHLDDAAEALIAVAPYLGRPEISIARSPIVDPSPLHACAT